MAKNANYKIGVGVAIQEADIQKKLNEISTRIKPTLKTAIYIQPDQLKQSEKYTNNIKGQEDALKRVNKQHEEEQSRLVQIKSLLNSMNTMRAIKTNEANTAAFEGTTRQNSASKSAAYFNQVFSNYRRYGDVITETNDKIGKYDENQRRILNATAKINNVLPKSTSAYKTLGDVLKNNIAKFAEWTIAATLTMQTIRQIRAAVEYVKDIDKAMTNLQIITGMSESSARDLVEQYNALGREIGATTIQVAEGAEEWIRAGKTAEEALNLTRQSLTLSKLSGMSASEATQSLISSLNGYKLAASEAASVVDKLIAVDNKAATSSRELATAMSYVAAVAAGSGVNMDKLIGLIGTVSSVTRQSAESIGTMWKSVISRMGNVKAGKFVDDETGESLSDVEAVLGKVNIKLRESEDSYRDFGDVLDDVGKRWSTFTELERAAVGTALGGRQCLMPQLVAMQG